MMSCEKCNDRNMSIWMPSSMSDKVIVALTYVNQFIFAIHFFKIWIAQVVVALVASYYIIYRLGLQPTSIFGVAFMFLFLLSNPIIFILNVSYYVF